MAQHGPDSGRNRVEVWHLSLTQAHVALAYYHASQAEIDGPCAGSRIYIDEDAMDGDLIAAIRSRGITAIRALDAGLTGKRGTENSKLFWRVVVRCSLPLIIRREFKP